MTPAESDPSLTYDPRARQRRILLLLAGCSLLAVGIGINVHRHRAWTPEREHVVVIHDESYSNEQRFVAFMMQPDSTPEEAPEEVIEDSEDEAEAGGMGQRHRGAEGRMGRPTSKNKSGLYAMKGPSDGIPQLARSFDPEMASRNAGILGVMQQDSGHFLASPYGAAFSVGNDDEDVWGGLTGTAVADPGPARPAWDATAYPQWVDQVFVKTDADRVSTFSIDVDTGTYSLVRRSLLEHRSLPVPSSVRVEEMINYFDYEYPEPSGDVPVSITTEVGPCPWDDAHRLVHVGLQGKHVALGETPPRNLVFLVDVSGSMSEELPLVVSSLAFLTEQLGERDHIAIVVYAGAAGTVLPPTAGSDKTKILGALERLEAGGSTNGGEGIEQAYRLAQQHFVKGGINRVVLATDGDFNVGTTSLEALVELIEQKRESGVFLSVLGFGDTHADQTMEQLADKGNGNYAFIDGLPEARKVLVEQAGSTLVTIAKDVKIQVELDPELVARYRLVGYTNRVLADRDFADDTKDAGEIGAGHTVTALYEIEPTEKGAEAGDEPLMELKLRYKEPDGKKSKLVQVPVTDRGTTLAQTSDDFRFSAAVAGFGQVLQGLPSKVEVGSLESLRDLARGARGADRQCRRAEFVGLVEAAGAIAGHRMETSSFSCQPSDAPRPVVYAEPLQAEDAAEAEPQAEPFDWQRFVLEVLYLLPPLLALPLFIMALRRPRRRSW